MGQALVAFRRPALPDYAPIIAKSLDDDLRLLLLEAFAKEEVELLHMGFERCVDHPDIPAHRYLEGYFHSIPAENQKLVASVHPRLGCELQRSPAPAPLFAFCEAFRRLNAAFFARLQSDLEGSKTAAPLADVLKRRAHFADISVQVHWGDEVPLECVCWHVDAANSLVHMALGLQGRRGLHARRNIAAGRIHQNCALGLTDEREILWQAEGSAYLGSPCCYPHAVEYPAAYWSKRIVAVQCRLHLTEDEMFGNFAGRQHTMLDADPRGGTAAIVFRHFASVAGQGLVMPRLSDIQNIMEEFRRSALSERNDSVSGSYDQDSNFPSPFS